MAAPPQPPAGPRPALPRPSWLWFVLLSGLAVLWLVQSSTAGPSHPTVEYSTLLGWVRAGKVKEVVLRPAELEGTLSEPQKQDGTGITEFRAELPRDDRLVALLDDKGVKIRVDNQESSLLARIV